MYAKVTAHRGVLICELLAQSSNEEVASSIDRPGNLGQMIMNTKKNLGVSEEALALLETVKRSGDAIGDVDWFPTAGENMAAFGWLGPPKRLLNPQTAEGSRQYRVMRELCQIIPNESDPAAIAAVDEIRAKEGAAA